LKIKYEFHAIPHKPDPGIQYMRQSMHRKEHAIYIHEMNRKKEIPINNNDGYLDEPIEHDT
jgi:hypothetical protein